MDGVPRSNKLPKEEMIDEARFWGAFGFYSLLTLAYLLFGLSGGFVTFLVSAFMLPAWISFRLSTKFFGHQSLRSTACYVVPLIPCLTYSIYFGGFLAAFLIEKMGMTGSHPPPYGYFVPDVIIAVVIGLVTGWCVGPLLPVVGKWLAKSSVVWFLLHGTVLALAVTSQFFPYNDDAPKRIILQHTVQTLDANQILDASYDFAVVDSNSMMFVFKHAPEAVKELHGNRELSFDTVKRSDLETWKGIFPISSLFSRSLKFPRKTDDVVEQYRYFPHLSIEKSQVISVGASRRVNIEFSLGSLKEVWVAVLNITGPLSNWSFANNTIPAPIKIGNLPPSYICRLSGAARENWTFWLEASSSEPLRVDVAVVDLFLTEPTKKLKGLFPSWMDITTFTNVSFRHVNPILHESYFGKLQKAIATALVADVVCGSQLRESLMDFSKLELGDTREGSCQQGKSSWARLSLNANWECVLDVQTIHKRYSNEAV
ncbi:endoplasmic reticulum metallopeptidase 1 [Phtheirospermum japonicum]|uniref:Endoplasmic reticulum metallopeptidase 1 n=1 Tax=Phtheirospermum japonicum TaxID=374723 RepID=A0A830BLK3_9LAMI|nr:endoplasmic reticulum metallopeptidase 1 [Phtheirospermum japonicum]